ncbi:MAG TPA: S1 RNA-binding domain-containing protein [Planctomycetaceae bacterium]|nr:S1 RNA-binding domain-containing protein [Planctomycetaceae bacterium]
MNGDQGVSTESGADVSVPENSTPSQTNSTEAAPVVENAAPPSSDVPPPAVVDAPAEQTEADGTPKRKLQLNPTASADQFKAIPTYGSSGTAPTSQLEATPGNPPSIVPPEVIAVYQDGPREPVTLPEKNAPLDADLEAELNSAMSGAMAGASAVGSVVAPSTVAGAVVPANEDQVEVGAKLKAKVQSVSAEHVFCEVGFRVPALLPAKQFPQGKQPHVGEEFLVVVDKFDAENGVILVSLPKATRRPKGNWEDLAVGHVVECTVNKTNKGGLEVTVSNMRAFLPASQVDLGFIGALESYVGQRFAVQVTEVNPAKRNLVVSRRALLIQERKEAAANFWQGVEVGQQFSGKVKTIKDYGAFIDLGGCDGFLHVGEMSWTRIKHPSEVLQEGQPVDVVILSLDREKQKIGLGMKQLAQNPWNAAAEKYAAGRTVSGRVTRTTDFGAFVELEQGVEGLIHISELDHRRVKRVTEVLSVGQEIQAQVLEVEPERQRISLSLKALKAKPEVPKDEDLAPGKGQAYVSKRKEPLKGGTGNSGGGLFGNPGDFQ